MKAFQILLLPSSLLPLVAAQISWPSTVVSASFPSFEQESSALAALSSDLSSYYASLTAEPAYTSALDALTSAIPSNVDPEIATQQLETATVTPSWFAAMPTQAQDYWASVANENVAIATKALDLENEANIVVVSIAVVVGAIGIAALMM
ncbi:hypothetical protein K402DRAFT_417539 [Aulographum hederae CBS 113979]|uniref:Uncharacterized protein n=1 Tax=Aulographum hederae CBS 113979 TaxID=1176131 RepID=A0A6G1HCJ7_9PEZI|nr:hypothetical protein K402DRAFT_417539 [Aulographum hederae CBS 113979]